MGVSLGKDKLETDDHTLSPSVSKVLVHALQRGTVREGVGTSPVAFMLLFKLILAATIDKTTAE